MQEVPRPWAGIALLGAVWGFFAIGAAYGMWPWRPDFWPYFYSMFLLAMIVPRRWLSGYLLILAILIASMGINWFVIGSKKGDALLGGFLFAAAILGYASWRARKMPQSKVEEEPSLPLPRNPYAF